MSSQRAALRVYRDFEKLYRLGALYQGNVKPLERHVQIIDANLSSIFKQSDSPLSLQFDFLMNGVYSNGEAIYTPANMETSLAYGLFCEGVQSIVVMKDLTAIQLLEFSLMIRGYFDSANSNAASVDLASILWKQSFQNIRVYLYSLLLESHGDKIEASANGHRASSVKSKGAEGGVQILNADGTVGSTGTSPDRSWHQRDKQWDLPSGELRAHRDSAGEDLNLDKLESLRSELADVSINDRAQKIVRFGVDEIKDLASELESFDQNQVEFNTVAHYFSAMKSDLSLSPGFQQIIFDKTVTSALDRFHGGLITFILSELEALKAHDLAQDQSEGKKNRWQTLTEGLQKSIEDPKRLQILAASFGDAHRSGTSRRFFPYLSFKGIKDVLELMVDEGNQTNLQNFIRFLIRDRSDCEAVIFGLSEQALAATVKVVGTLSGWRDQKEFLKRCLFHRSSEVTRAALGSIQELALSVNESMNLFQRLNDKDRGAWAQSVLAQPDRSAWTAFLKEWVKSKSIQEISDNTLLLWIRLALETAGAEALHTLEPFVTERKFFLWAKFPREREAILNAALQAKSPVVKTQWGSILKRESELLFQDSELKERLRSA